MHARPSRAAMVAASCLAAGLGGGCDPGTTPPNVIDAKVGSGAIDAAPPGTPDATTAKGPAMIYVGGSDNHIHIYAIDETSLALTEKPAAAAGNNPSFLAFDPKGRWLVAVNENAGQIESYAIAPATGALTKIDAADSHGAGPTHVSIDRSGAYAMVADYTAGAAAVIPIGADGHFATATATVSPGMNAHEILTNAANNVVYVPCLGSDRVAVFGFDAATGKLTARTPATTATKAGPRHMALSPDGAHAWVINELTSTITTYTIGGDGTLTAGATVSSRQAGASGANTGAEIAVHPSGKWLYASNRGDNAITVFSIGAGGAITLIDHVPTGGATPRHFSLVLGGAALLVANQDGNTVYGFHLDVATGKLTSVGKLADVSGPQFVGDFRLP